MVRKPDVAPLTRLVSGSMRRAGQLGRMTTFTGAVIGRRPDEVVGCVTALALDARVKRRVLVRGLVARAAVAGARLGVAEAGVRIVTADARACLAFLGMIRLLGRVTPGAGLIWTALDVVWTVAARTLLMRRHARLTQSQDVLVTAAARRGLFLGKLVRAMAAHAFHVPALEQGARRNDRLLLRVARSTRSECIGGRRVLILVARRAHLVGRLALERVSGNDLAMTLAARA
jgi:hypothetical protein